MRCDCTDDPVGCGRRHDVNVMCEVPSIVRVSHSLDRTSRGLIYKYMREYISILCASRGAEPEGPVHY